MSKSQPEYKNEAPGEWRPLDIRQLEKFQTLEIDYGLSNSARDEAFRLIYDTCPARETAGEFRPIYKKTPGMNDGGAKGTGIDSGRDSRHPEGEGAQQAEPGQRIDPKQIEKNAYAEGFAKGEQEGLAAGKKKSEAMADRFQMILSDIEGLWQRMVATYEKEILGLVFRAVEKVVMGHVQSDNETVKRSILKAFEIIPEPTEVSIKIHPDDYEFIELIKEDIFVQIKELKNVELISDHSVKRGGCTIETRSGNVVVDIEKRLESIKNSMVDANRIKG